MSICDDYIDSDSLIKTLKEYNDKKKCNIPVLEDTTKNENCDNINLCSYNEFCDKKVYNLKCNSDFTLFDVKCIIEQIIKSIKVFIKEVTKLKCEITSRDSKEMKSYLAKYKLLIHIFITDLKQHLSRRKNGYYIMNNLFYINQKKCIQRASYKNVNNLKRCSVNQVYSIPGITIIYNSSNLYLKIVIHKCKFNFQNGKSNTYKYAFTSKLSSNCNKISKNKFIEVIDSIYNYQYSKCNHLKEIITFFENELSFLKIHIE